MSAVRTIPMVVIVGIVFLFCGGCVAAVENNVNEKHVKGFGLDINFYPFPSIRFGYYDYILKIEK